MTDRGAKCLILEKKNHIGGNCHTTEKNGIHVHDYGPHIFHTNSDKIWNYVNKYAEFNNYVNRPKVNYKNDIFSFPINLFTLYQLWGVKTPEEAKAKLNKVKIKIENPKNLEEWILTQVGEEIYNKFIYGYTKKQWGQEPANLPSFIIKRLPIRLTYDDNYYEDKYQGIPIGGYTQIFKKLLKDIPIEIGVDYLLEREYWNSKAKKIVYTGPIDEFFNYEMGTLEWRSLKFEQQELNIDDYQGNAIVNYTEYEIPYTRICEHKHFENNKLQGYTIITKEYPQQWDKSKEKYYPINDDLNNNLYLTYKNKIDTNRYIFGGRLADYKYYDMHQVIGSALVRSENESKIYE
jgi:UDP-galactopyranose mutase